MNEMGTFLDVLYDLLLHPRAGMRAVVTTQTLARAFGVVVVSALVFIVSLLGGGAQGGAQVLLALLFAFEMVCNWAAFVAIWHLIAALFGADGQVRDFLKAAGFVHVLQLLFVPVLLLVNFLPEGMRWLGALAAPVLAGWSLYLLVLAVCEVYGVGRGKATLILIAPLLFMIAVGLLLFLSLGSYLVMLVQQSDALLQAPMF